MLLKALRRLNYMKNSNDNPVLIYDKVGIVGERLISRLSKDHVCVFITTPPQIKRENTYVVSLTKKLPVLPKATYSSFILHFNNDKMLLDLLPEFAKKAKGDDAHIYFLISVRDAREKLIDQVLSISERITIIIVGDLFGDERISNPAVDMLKRVKEGEVSVGDALAVLYPVGIEDFIAVVEKLVPLKGISGHGVLYALPPHPVTRISFARQLHKKEPLLLIKMESEKEALHSEYLPPSYVSVFGQGYDYQRSFPEIKILSRKQPAKKSKKRAFRLRISFRKMLYLVTLSLLLAFFATPIFTGLIGAGFLARTHSLVIGGELAKAKSSAKASEAFFLLAKSSSGGLQLFRYVGVGGHVERIIEGVTAGEVVAKAVVLGIDGISSLNKVISAESLDPKRDLQMGMQNIRQAVLSASIMRIEGKIPQQYTKYFDSAEKLTTLANGLFDVLPELVGMEGKKKYLILFQNNMELRPGGGFIGSYGVLHMDKGRIIEFPIHDVYDADGQLSQHIEPPFQLRRYLGASHWFLRDSNFDIDFTKNGASAAFFYNAETKDVVDGVIAIDTSVLRKLLKATGPLKVAGYPETLTSDNFFPLTESYAQDNFFPGSNQKQNFLKAVSISIFAHLTENENVSYQAIAEVIAESITEKHMLFAFPDKKVQRVFDINGGGSSLADVRLEKDNAFNDYLGINEANLGQNKVNYYLDRSISHRVNIVDTELQESVTIHYVNRSKESDKYGGDYKAYLRVILPGSAVLQSVSFDGISQDVVPAVTDPAVFGSRGFVPQTGLEVERTEVDGKVVYGFLNIVPRGKNKKVTISYKISVPLSPAAFDYSLRMIKQPGTSADSYVFSFNYPGSYKMLNSSEGIKNNGNAASLLTNLLQDREIEITLGKK